jgi:hypothetical protein
MQDYASVVLIELINEKEIALWAVSVNSTSVELSGAWVIPAEDSDVCKQIISGRLILLVGKSWHADEVLTGNTGLIVELSDFIREAKGEAESALVTFNEFVLENERKYKEYMAIEKNSRKLLPKISRKKLVTPVFFDWPEKLTIDQSEKYLESKGKFGSVGLSGNGLDHILTATRCVQFLISMWQADEVERRTKVYIEGDAAEVTVLPKVWLNKLNELTDSHS